MNKELFKEYQIKNGDTNESLATALGIERHALGLKLNEKRQFKIDEVAIIANRYNLTADDVYKIFFT